MTVPKPNIEFYKTRAMHPLLSRRPPTRMKNNKGTKQVELVAIYTLKNAQQPTQTAHASLSKKKPIAKPEPKNFWAKLLDLLKKIFCCFSK